MQIRFITGKKISITMAFSWLMMMEVQMERLQSGKDHKLAELVGEEYYLLGTGAVT